MGRTPWVVYMWPGLPQIWTRGHFGGLLVAFGCAVLLDLLLLGTFVWSELLDSRLRTLGWAVVAVIWGAWAILSIRIDSHHDGFGQENRSDDRFALVAEQYLKRNWLEAEHLLRTLVTENPADADARMMLLSLLRRTGRTQEAMAELAVLQSLPGAAKWACEIERERALLAAASPDTRGENPPQEEGASQIETDTKHVSKVSHAA